MHVNGSFYGYTLEDTYRGQLEHVTDKIDGKTAIPVGTYTVSITHSNRFHKDLPLLANVPRFSGVRIHGGNSAADTLGCILLGAATNHVDNVSNCAALVQGITDLIRKAGTATIQIINQNAVV